MRRGVALCVFFFALAVAKANDAEESSKLKSFPAPGTEDESELLVKYMSHCADNYRIAEAEKSGGTNRNDRAFDRLTDFITADQQAGSGVSSRSGVDVEKSASEFSFISRRTATFGGRRAGRMSAPQAIGLDQQMDNVRHAQDRPEPLSITCEYQKFAKLDVCKLSNYEGRINTRKIEAFLNSDPCVEFAEFSIQMKNPMDDEENEIIENMGQKFSEQTLTYNDLYFSRFQWFLQDAHSYSVNAQSMWGNFVDNGASFNNNTGVVGIVDTGAWMRYPSAIHEDLRNKMWRNEADCDFDGVDSDGNGYVDDCNGWNFGANNNDLSDYHGHGTAVSGTVGAETNNRRGVASVGRDVKILTLKTYFRSSEFAKMVNYMAGFGVKIMNGSFAFARASAALKSLAKTGEDNNILMIFAASNENCDNDAISSSSTGRKDGCDLYPASLPNQNIVSVCSSNEHGRKSYFSSYGKTTVDVCAPGSGIFTTRLSSGLNSYGRNSGTSFAAPIVAGIAGMVALQHPSFSYIEIASAIKNSCNAKVELTNYAACGGIVDANKALQWAS